MPKIIEKTSVTAKGQITIPKKYRDILKLKPNDTVTFRIKQDSIEVIPFTSNIINYFGKIKPRKTPEDFKYIREDIEKTLAKEIKK
jgi:AbrB family looped-hinge helix DNA binding protein